MLTPLLLSQSSPYYPYQLKTVYLLLMVCILITWSPTIKSKFAFETAGFVLRYNSGGYGNFITMKLI